ncbi:NAD(P)/FAD-dependent oxidoreductase [Plastorhodobacter daqingensis]|uniref:NAD(P)/FAD-dependent oxidoreductase n=1 Tax=Plastorhodobacter daqingensis TaxID=1387281 RepID=A0ABW2UHP3_9RHOB
MGGIVVVGAGQAGAALVARLRSRGYDGPLTLVGAETVPPYQRPPLTKGYLTGDIPLERLFLRPTSFYADHNITLRLGEFVTGIDTARRRLRLGPDELAYDQLALTTGSTPRRLPEHLGGSLGGVYVARDLADTDAMAPELVPGRKVLVVGGGYIGLEAAAVAAKRGLDVTLVEMAPRILQRVAAPETSDFFRALHQGHGVRICEGIGLETLVGENGRVAAARLSDGRELPVDFVIVGVGIVPNVALAEAAGVVIDNGIATDAMGRTSDPAIWAAGDCASFPWGAGRLRLESVQNAIDQAELVADNMMGAGRHYAPVPWFWSDQYDVKLQIAGLNSGYDRLIRRDAAPKGLSFWYFRGDRFLAVDAINDPRAFMVGKRLLEMGRAPSPEALAAPETDLKTLLA